MKIKEFFESKEKLAIKITTIEDLIKICEAFDKEGFMYSAISKYTDKLDMFIDYFKNYGNICLSNTSILCSYGFCEIDWYIKGNYKIITINDIEFEETMTIAEYFDKCDIYSYVVCEKCYELKNGKNCDGNCEECEFGKFVNIANYLKSTYTPKQEITLTEFEKQFILNLDEKYKWCTRGLNGTIWLHNSKPTKLIRCWVIDGNSGYGIYDGYLKQKLFPFIKWEDEEPWSIEELKEIANGK